MHFKQFLLAIGCLFCLMGCNRKNTIMCTEEFRMVSIKVTGKKLSAHYTIREKNKDTLELLSQPPFSNETYLVLDDNYQPYFINQQEKFRFVGLIQDTVVVNEIFEISADNCHIQYISGKTQVNL